jgi:hypothetical protein
MGVHVQGKRRSRVEAVGSLEWCASQSCMDGGIVLKLDGHEVFVPSFVERIEVVSETMEHGTVGALGQPLGLGVVRCGKANTGAAELEEPCPEG